VKKVLVANRGEIAIRIMRACRELGLASVAVYSEADEGALFARYADEAYCIGPPPAIESYLNITRIIEVAKESGAIAIHPGYGFLAENPNFVRACEREGIKFIGPSSRVISLFGDKIASRREMRKAGVPVVPGSYEPVRGLEEAKRIAAEIGYPVMVKPSGGGAGIGMVVVNSEEELGAAIGSSQSIAASTFALSDVYLEKYIPHARHIEIQLMADSFGHVIHLGERECSVQRRHQKLVEESPSPVIDKDLRHRMGGTAVKAANSVGYESVGTIEFLFSNGNFYFLEANTRIQVEHGVTEMVTGVDIVKEQIKMALGEPLSVRQEDVHFNGWAIECRINAEDPLTNFSPSPGRLKGYRSPGGIGVRIDSGVFSGYNIPEVYDPMISKLIVWGRDRDEAIKGCAVPSMNTSLSGLRLTSYFHKAVMENPRFVKGELETTFVDLEYENLLSEMKTIMGREKPLEEKLSHILIIKVRMPLLLWRLILRNSSSPED